MLVPLPWDHEVYSDHPLVAPVKLDAPLEMSLYATCDAGQLPMSFPSVVSD